MLEESWVLLGVRWSWGWVGSRGLLGACVGLGVSRVGALDTQKEGPEGLLTPHLG